jgi:RHS repeat-associated protein
MNTLMKRMSPMSRPIRALWLALLLIPAAAHAQDQVVYYHTDAIGSVRAITDATGAVIGRYDYLPFGELWPSVPPPPTEVRQFGGKERDEETGLDNFGARHMRAASGRFTTVDPLMDLEAALTDPQRWNRYSYVVNRPLVMIDPDGREAGYVYMPNGRMLSPYDYGFPRSRNPVRDTVGLAAAFGGALFAGPVVDSVRSLAIEAQIALGRALVASAGASGTAEQIDRATTSGGPTVRVVTNLTQFPREGRGLSVAVGENAQALANAFRSGNGVRTFSADLPTALIRELQKARLLETRSTVAPNGMAGIEYRFAPGAYKYIVKFFDELR